MFFEIIGFLFLGILISSFLAFKITKDISPKGFKKFLIKIFLKNWQNKEEAIFRSSYKDYYNAKDIHETGIFSSQKEYEAEKPRINFQDEADELVFYGIDESSNGIFIKVTNLYENLAQGTISLFNNGHQFEVEFNGKLESKHEFSIENLKIELVDPMRIWRISYNGPFLDITTNLLIHAKFQFLWKALEVPEENRKDLNINLIANLFNENGKFGENFSDLKELIPLGYNQMGTLFGNIFIDDEKTEEIHFHGFRTRRILKNIHKSNDNINNNLNIEFFGITEAPNHIFRLYSNKNTWINVSNYYVNMTQRQISEVDNAIPDNFRQNSTLPKLFTLKDDCQTSSIEIWPVKKDLKNFNLLLVNINFNGKNGKGIIIRHGTKMEQNIIKLNIDNRMSISKEISNFEILSLDSKDCLNVNLVGGKGASLAKLREISENEEKFRNSKGFCTTINLFKQILDLEKIDSIFVKNSENIELACKEVISYINQCENVEKIRPLIEIWMDRIFDNAKETRFAVRSSGILEDSSALSCAGQNETFLGVSKENVPEKIIQCWSSLFTVQSVKYRLNNGQSPISEMGVVVQEMVNAKVAGVTFTADPLTGNPFKININANYGLGESVVSAECDPDIIEINLSRDPNQEELIIGTKKLGNKKTKIILNEDGKSETETISLNKSESDSFCLSDDTSLELAKIAIFIKNKFGKKPVDIEWAIDSRGVIYILQCRDITTLNLWTDFEIIHEYDASIRNNNEIFTIANTGEVLPSPVSHTYISTGQKCLDLIWQSQLIKSEKDVKFNPYIGKSMGTQSQRSMIGIYQIMYRIIESKISAYNIGIDLSIFGHSVMNEDIHKNALERFGVAKASVQIKNLLNMIKLIIRGNSNVKKAEAKFKDFELNFENLIDDYETLYQKISEENFTLLSAAESHITLSQTSSASQFFAFIVLSEGKEVEKWDSEFFEDVSKIFTGTKTAESADIPNAIGYISDEIIKEKEKFECRKFIKSNEEEALNLMKENKRINKALNEFMRKHGHRGVAELDPMSLNWKLNPKPFIKLIQSIVKSKLMIKSNQVSQNKDSVDVNDVDFLNSLKTTNKSATKKILKWLLPYSRSSVVNRERTKSLLVKVVGEIGGAYRILGKSLVKAKILTDEKHIFFLTHLEIGQLIKKDPYSPIILKKVLRRYKLYPELCKAQFPELSFGIPKKVEIQESFELEDSVNGTPVYPGKIKATVKVCLSIEEAGNSIEPGDILVTHSTDIGWSPFFPILGGIVTELGGLISHGAVVAREYSLPCLVGASNATKIFKSGDQVFLDISKGILAKVKE